MTTLPDDDMTELVDFRPDRVDLVGKGANGIPFLIAKQDESSRGLIPPGVVRDLIAKADPEPAATGDGPVTMTGSPAAIAAFIHKASVRPADDVAKAEMSAKAKNDLPDSAFAFIEPGGKKDESGRTTPRSLRHFPLTDDTHIRNALSQAPKSPFGDKAMPKIKAAAKKAGIDVAKAMAEAGIPEDVIKAMTADTVTKDALVQDPDTGMDGMDPTVPMAAPDGDDAPGDPTDPGSPAWEAIDAATAQKWTAIAVRLKNALGILADRENLEALTADPDDAENAWDLQDAMSACDFVIGTLAGFAVSEQAEADLACEAMDSIGKAMTGFDPAPLDVIEGLASVRKAGRVLSAANEAKVRSATESLQQVLASLPSAPVADDSVTKEAAMPATQTKPEDAETVAKGDHGTSEAEAKLAATREQVTKAEGDAPSLPVVVWDRDGGQGMTAWEGITKAQPGQIALYGQDGALIGLVRPGEPLPVAKADADSPEKTPMQAVFDQNGKLIGIVDPDAITPVAGAGGAPADDKSDDPAKPEDPAAAKPADPADMTPAPSADAGTPADDDVTKASGEADAKPDDDTTARNVLKSLLGEALSEYLGAPGAAEGIAKQADVAGLGAKVEGLLERIAKVEEMPAAPKVFTNGQVPPAGQLRGQDHGAAQVDVAKAQQVRREFLAADPAEQNRLAGEMQQGAIGTLAAIHAAGPTP